jgi:anti-sigma regulatory factor (Ser/Thr protein kinase)
MHVITTHWAELFLTAQQVAVWPETSRPLPPAHWPRAARRVELSLPSSDRSVPVCRALVGTWLDARHIRDGETRHLVLLVLSEFLTNAIQYSGSDRIVCRLWKSRGLLFVDVRDQGRTCSVPQQRCPGQEEEHGRGLALVADSVGRWGFQAKRGQGCSVWAAIDLKTALADTSEDRNTLRPFGAERGRRSP